MKKKQPVVIITFSTTTQAMKMEKYCIENKIAGRLIPVPTTITAGCGLAWKAGVGQQADLVQRLGDDQIDWEKMYVIEM